MFSYYPLKNAQAIAKDKEGQKIYFIDDPYAYKDEDKYRQEILTELYKKEPTIKEIKEFMSAPILFKELKITDRENEYFPIPDLTFDRFVCSIIGASGSGKSVFASKLLKQYHKMQKENEIFLFSNKARGEDPALDLDFITEHVDINEHVTKPINVTKYPNSLFVFDDIIESIVLNEESTFFKSVENEKPAVKARLIKERQQELQRIINQSIQNILSLGRSRKISCIMIRHAYKNGGSNLLKSEATHIVSFPTSNGAKFNEYLKDYEGLSRNQIKAINSLEESKSRFQFIYMSKQGCKYIVSNRNIISLENY